MVFILGLGPGALKMRFYALRPLVEECPALKYVIVKSCATNICQIKSTIASLMPVQEPIWLIMLLTTGDVLYNPHLNISVGT